jgi:hypothetical protein
MAYYDVAGMMCEVRFRCRDEGFNAQTLNPAMNMAKKCMRSVQPEAKVLVTSARL